MSTSDKKMHYLEKSILWNPWWVVSKKTCTAVDAEEFSLSMNRPAPPLRDQPPPPPKPPEPKRAPRSLLEGFLDFKDWLNTPLPPESSKPTVVTSSKPKVKPFDLQDIPDALDRVGWPMSAKLQRKWFSGELNYATTDEGAAIGINQNGKPFPSSMVDTTMFQLDWILGFDRARIKYDELLNRDYLFSRAAIRVLKKKFIGKGSSAGYVDPWRLCGADIQRWHREYQFQLITVDSGNLKKFEMFLRGVAWKDGTFMDDLYGALGAFSINAALGEHQYVVDKTGWRGRLIVNEIVVYMRDVFTFHDRSGEVGTQYLGHWNKRGFIVVPIATVVGELTELDWPNYPVALYNAISDATVYYPVRNKDYRIWQMENKQGGDMVLYSDRRSVRLNPPKIIEFDFSSAG